MEELKRQILCSSVTMPAMCHGQGLHHNSQELPQQSSSLIPLYKKGTTVNLAHSESAQKQSHETIMGTRVFTSQPLTCSEICLLLDVCDRCNNRKKMNHINFTVSHKLNHTLFYHTVQNLLSYK